MSALPDPGDSDWIDLGHATRYTSTSVSTFTLACQRDEFVLGRLDGAVNLSIFLELVMAQRPQVAASI